MTIQSESEEKKILKLIANTPEEFLQSAGSGLSYQKITDNILYISGAKYAAFDLYDEDGVSFTITAISAPQEVIKKASSFLGFKVIGKKWEPSPAHNAKIKSQIITHFVSLNELTGEVITKPAVSLLEKTFGIREVVFVKIAKGDLTIGSFILAMPKNIKLKNEDYIELYSRQLGLLMASKHAEKAMRTSLQYSRNLIETSLDPFVTISADGKITDVNSATEKITGISRQKLIGNDFADLFTEPEKACAGYMEAFKLGQVVDYPLAIRHTSGKITDVLYNASVYRNERGEVLGVFAAARDITEHKKAEAKIAYLSFHDYLTGLYNRRFFEEEVKRLNAERQLPLSFIMGDVSGLKIINDIFGHNEGDRLLKETAKILKTVCRSDDILARWGGDEFVLLLPKTSVSDSEEIVERIIKECKKTHGQKIPIYLSLGVAKKETVSQDIRTILNDAESNMYKNKLAQKESLTRSIILSLEHVLYEKSIETKKHVDRIRNLALSLGKSIKLSSIQLGELSLVASLHDIGKVAIPETILLKKGKLTEKDWSVIKRHPEKGFNVVQSSSQIAHIAKPILYCHENWDGSGYPFGMKGESIPILSRIILIADAYDVLTIGRTYKLPLSKDDAIKELKRCSGSQFDPALVDKFIKILSKT